MVKKIAALVGFMSLLGSSAYAMTISGAGATFPAPVYGKWANDYRSKTGIVINYQPIGSGGGIKQINASTIDFGASDKPLKTDELSKGGLYQFPTVMGGIVPIVNLPGLRSGRLHLTGSLLADIYLGKITKWNDNRIASINPWLKLPAVPITVVHRADGSGTSFQFTSYLTLKSSEWASRVGASDAVQWPSGLGGKGNDGVAAFVKQTVGAIGYVEYAYTRQSTVPYALIANYEGQFPHPSTESFTAASAAADWTHAPGNGISLLDQKGKNSWPLVSTTYILLHKTPNKPETTTEVLKFFDWAYQNGDSAALSLDYAPLPKEVKTFIRQQWPHNIQVNGKPVYNAH
ncbi:MAG: phosphate ABC transporter substrate-binding protein PstS [Zymomonas mobilis subsp. pomaceae]|uniref:Phosphate-binding protein PstS n=1 Tax=Zymomonas mobilis subsp. pomaceae (strain ATCC 29192 / DSM 22645 / JCM 10191 / CCUG 17912 / NBRC 13757 / NCIMB 11200 / NRRL B-4491 / Barker I) TaxID=579138 RepID=F8EU60_ZYMMT|nr:phosphate ABC transporter substrate-binding protein PstS [Zymomonas mobilis]AEI37140.1 phosphate ABC transporter, periplasmic phosphate-binding protein [Zymomonas mobilis subsp. pomaceae ATCC 29192]MDX5948511.1 phosphate ABC transporter substrate-binding protein PstS [Zymomonas mobilis subsp. pomaceae]GEB89424.1 phosphate-binding protein PstS [Zymomonas mobilis subsp. pomaceae]